MRRVKKSFIFLSLILVFFSLNINKVSADTSCNDLNDLAEEYNTVVKEIESLGCAKEAAASKLQCDNLNIRKTKLLTEIFELNDVMDYCDKNNVNNIISNNKDTCTNELSTKMYSLSQTIYKYFYIIGTFLFLVFGSLDFFKNIIEADPEKMPKNKQNFIKRLIALVLIYLLPLIINLIFSLLPSRFSLGTNKYVCTTGTKVGTGSASTSGANINVEPPTTNTGTVDAKKNKAKRNQLAAQAKAVKKYTKDHNTFWCAKRTNSKGKIINPACSTKKVENLLGNKQKYNGHTGGYSCASLASIVLYKTGIYSASDINGHNINSAWQTAKYLRDKGWKVITDKKKLEPGDFLFYNRSSKKPLEIKGLKKAPRPGHVDIYAGGSKVYNTGGTSLQNVITSGFDSSTFAFALRYPGE